MREFASSGLTHGLGEVHKLAAHFHLFFSPKTFNDNLNQDGSYSSRYLDNNFGLVDFYFDNEDPNGSYVEWSIRGKYGEEIYRRVLSENEFRYFYFYFFFFIFKVKIFSNRN